MPPVSLHALAPAYPVAAFLIGRVLAPRLACAGRGFFSWM